MFRLCRAVSLLDNKTIVWLQNDLSGTRGNTISVRKTT